MSRRLGRRLVQAALVVLMLAGAWGLASVLAGRHAAAALERLAASSATDTNLRVRALAHEGGWFRSQGTLELHWVDDCTAERPDEPLFSARVRYRLSHALVPGALVRFDWTLEPIDSSARAFERLFGSRVSLSGQGRVDFSGDLSSTLALPAWQVRDGGQQLAMSASQGRIAWGERSLGLDWKASGLSLQGHGPGFALEGLALNLQLRDRLRGTGRTSLEIARIAGPSWSLEGLNTRSEVTERGDRLDASASQTVRSLKWSQQELRDLAVEAAVRDLHLPSIEALSRLAGQSCGFVHLGADEARRFRDALRTLLLEGFSVGLPRVGGSAGQGQLEGTLSVALQRETSAAPVISLARSLRLDAQLRLKGEVLNADQRETALELGLLRDTPQGLQAQLTLQGGQLQANGRELDAGMVRLALETADARLNALLAEAGPWETHAPRRSGEESGPGTDADRPQPAPEPLGPPDGPKR